MGERKQIKNGDKISIEEFDSLSDKDKAIFEKTADRNWYEARIDMTAEEKLWNSKNYQWTEDKDVIKQWLEWEVSPELLWVVDTLDEILGNVFVSAGCNVV